MPFVIYARPAIAVTMLAACGYFSFEREFPRECDAGRLLWTGILTLIVANKA